jgi:hypothetical protein
LVASDQNPGHRISLQGAWEPPQTAARTWSRPFGRPVDLPAGERIDLVIVAPRPILESATLNGRSVQWRSQSADAAGMVLGRSEVTAELAARNELRLHADCGAESAAATGSRRGPLPETLARVWLEIHASTPGNDPGSVDHP